ncbi:MAG: hypothetical protein IKI38_00790 [Mogibacterium sp.]|nr:hypothetical protein [Mogibacterium sp.]
MKESAIPGREWLTCRGRRILWDCFIDIFDVWNPDQMLSNRSSKMYDQALRMGYGVQVMTDRWAHGMNTVSEYSEGLDYYQLSQPHEQRLPEALEELVEQIEILLRVSLDHQLDRAAERSIKVHEQREAERHKEQLRCENVCHIADTIPTANTTIPEKITWLLMLQERKRKGDYAVSESQREKEDLATELWCSLLIHSMNSETITHAQMKMLVEDGIIDEHGMSSLLQDKCQDHRDYEWYSEDYLGNDLNADTILKVADVLEEAEPVFRRILGISESIAL